MIIVMNNNAGERAVEAVDTRLQQLGFSTQIIYGVKRIVIGAVGDRRSVDMQQLKLMPGVENVIPIMQPYKMVSREGHPENTEVRVRDLVVGGPELVVIAGPCAVESREQLLFSAQAAKKAGASMLRGGAYKPRTSPYSFQGLEEEGLKILKEASELTEMPVVTEIIDEHSLDMAMDYVDIMQIGARNMQNFRLLKAVGRSGKPALLKRGMSATIEEWLMAAEYIVSEGNTNVILCERGIRTFETATRNTLDLSAVPLVKRLSHLPVMVDPSHGTGDRGLVQPMSLAAVAAGADGLIIEMHPNPAEALSDGPQSLTPAELEELMHRLEPIAAAVSRTLKPHESGGRNCAE